MFRQLIRGVRFYSDAVKQAGIKSSVPEGTVLKGCNVRKNGEDPVALADDQYPDWLWEVLDPEAQDRKLKMDPIRYATKQRREENRKRIKDQNFLAKMNK